MTARDRRYVVPTWAQSSHYDGLPKAARFRLVDRVLDDGARVVCLATDERTVHAWAAGAVDVLHYVYVPPELRGEGLARRAISALLGSYPERITVTHPWPRRRVNGRQLSVPRFDRYSPHLLHMEAA